MEGKLIGALLTFFERPQHCQTCCLSGSILYLPWVTKKTKINAHELEALRFFLPVPNTHRTHTIGRGRWAGPRHRAGPRHHSGRAEQGAGQGARSAAAAGCMSAPTRPASINSWQLGGRTSAAAEMSSGPLATDRCV